MIEYNWYVVSGLRNSNFSIHVKSQQVQEIYDERVVDRDSSQIVL